MSDLPPVRTPVDERCCTHCFGDPILIERVQAISTPGACTFCKHECDHTVSVAAIAPQFKHILNLYRPVVDTDPPLTSSLLTLARPATLGLKLRTHWSIFGYPRGIREEAAQLADAIVQASRPHGSEAVDLDALYIEKDESPFHESATWRWRNFAEALKHNYRFLIGNAGKDVAEQFEKLLTRSRLESMSVRMPELVAYRARRGDHYSQPMTQRQLDMAMGPPPQHKSTAGRANPAGIPVLYAATNPVTAVAEVRAFVGEEVTIVEVHSAEPLTLVDFRNPHRLIRASPFACDTSEGIREQRALSDALGTIGREMSTPVQKDDEQIEYVPTQYVVEYVRSHGFDGILYESALDAEGSNIVLFDLSRLYLDNPKVVLVSKVKYEITDDYSTFGTAFVPNPPVEDAPIGPPSADEPTG